MGKLLDIEEAVEIDEKKKSRLFPTNDTFQLYWSIYDDKTNLFQQEPNESNRFNFDDRDNRFTR